VIDLEVFDDTPGRSLGIEDLATGAAVFQRVRLTDDMLAAFVALANDRAPIHEDTQAAVVRGFEAPIVQGLALSTRFSRLIGMYLPGERAVLESVDLKFRRPVYRGTDLIYRAVVHRIFRPMHVVELALSISADGETCVSGACRCLIR
jgi:3-hydroxybutyryl-CoA dehydratase